MGEIRNPFGLVGNELMHVKNILKGKDVFCPVCGEKLILKDGSYYVKHLAHRTENKCNGESVIHKLVKEFIYNEVVSMSLQECKVSIAGGNIKLIDKHRLSVLEKWIEYRGFDGKYIPDIFLGLEDGYKVAIEICYKNKKDVNYLEDILPKYAIDQVIEIRVTDEDLEFMDVEDIIKRGKVIYNKLLDDYEKLVQNISRETLKYYGEANRLKSEITKLENLNKNLKNDISWMESSANEQIAKLKKKNEEYEKYKNTDVDKLKWQIQMLKDRLEMYVTDN